MVMCRTCGETCRDCEGSGSIDCPHCKDFAVEGYELAPVGPDHHARIGLAITLVMKEVLPLTAKDPSMRDTYHNLTDALTSICPPCRYCDTYAILDCETCNNTGEINHKGCPECDL